MRAHWVSPCVAKTPNTIYLVWFGSCVYLGLTTDCVVPLTSPIALVPPYRKDRSPDMFPEERGYRFGQYKSQSASIMIAVSERRIETRYARF